MGTDSSPSHGVAPAKKPANRRAAIAVASFGAAVLLAFVATPLLINIYTAKPLGYYAALGGALMLAGLSAAFATRTWTVASAIGHVVRLTLAVLASYVGMIVLGRPALLVFESMVSRHGPGGIFVLLAYLLCMPLSFGTYGVVLATSKTRSKWLAFGLAASVGPFLGVVAAAAEAFVL